MARRRGSVDADADADGDDDDGETEGDEVDDKGAGSRGLVGQDEASSRDDEAGGESLNVWLAPTECPANPSPVYLASHTALGGSLLAHTRTKAAVASSHWDSWAVASRVPTTTPEAPHASTDAIVAPIAIPPAASTGTGKDCGMRRGPEGVEDEEEEDAAREREGVVRECSVKSGSPTANLVATAAATYAASGDGHTSAPPLEVGEEALSELRPPRVEGGKLDR